MGKKRSKQTSSTLLEHLPNETFVEIFSHLNGIDAVFAFLQLNYRFQSLLFEYCQLFDFKSISKTKFDLVLQQHDRLRWKSLQLSNDDDTPGQIEYFIENYPLIEHFSQLQSLSILKLKSPDKLKILIDQFISLDISTSKPPYTYEILVDQLRSLTNLQSLTIESICGTTMTNLNLPKLKRLVLSSCRNTKWIMDLSQLENLEYTLTNCSCQADLTWPLSLKRLKIIFVRSNDLRLVPRSLSHLSQLITLEIYQNKQGQLYPNGQIWESLIRSSLPLLKHFKFYFQFKFTRYSIGQLEQITASFSTPFYLLEKKWFVRRDVYKTGQPLVAIYTVPFNFDQYTVFTNSFEPSISTHLINDNNPSSNNIYKNVRTLIFEANSPKPEKNFNRTNVVNLIINSHFESFNWIHVLKKLHHLEIKSDTMISSENFRLLLDNTPHLHSLAAEKSILWTLTENWSNLFICNHLSRNIRSLKLYKTDRRFRYMSRYELQQIIRIFSSKCQHLSLYVQSPINTIRLILKNMSQLHSLHVNITGENYPSIDMLWLEKQHTKFNASNCIIVNDGHNHYFWL